jgi:hypothetical protein
LQGGDERDVEGKHMESIQVPDQVAVQADMREVQIHVKWEGYDIALPVHVARLIADAAAQLVEQGPGS